MMFGLMREMKRKMMVVEEFVLFFPVKPELNSEIWTIVVLVNRHAE